MRIARSGSMRHFGSRAGEGRTEAGYRSCSGNRLYMPAGTDPNKRQLADAARLLHEPKTRQAWHRFLETLVRRYRADVKVREIWNEPNGPWFWQRPATVQQYGRMVKEVAGIIKRIDPEATILAGASADHVHTYTLVERQNGSPVIVYWLAVPMQTESAAATIRITLPEAAIPQPVLVDLLDGRVYSVESVAHGDAGTVFQGLPLSDSPLALCNRPFVQLEP